MADSYSRPASAFSFSFAGFNTNIVSDKLPEGKYTLAQNIRAYDDKSIRSRPGMVQFASSASNLPITALRAYATLQTDNTPRFLFKTGVNVALDNGIFVDTGYASGLGAAFIPYRPNQSPQSWMYIGDKNQYRKLSAPNASNVVTAQNAGIVEPQTPIDYGIGGSFFTPLAVTNNVVPSYTATNATIIGANPTGRVSDSVVAVFQDPALPTNTLPEYTVQVASSTTQYSLGMFVNIGAIAPNDYYQVKDVYPALVGTVQIAGIYYYAGGTGRCVVIPENIGATDNDGLSIMQQNLLTGIRRGALVQLGTEVCYVLGTALAPDGTISFEVVTVNNHQAGEVLVGVPAIKVLLSSNFAGAGGNQPSPGAAIGSPALHFSVASATVGSIQTPLGTTHPFSYQNTSYRPDDYIHFGIAISAQSLQFLAEIKVLLDVSDGTFDSDYYFYAFRPSDIQNGINNTLTQLGGAQLASQRQTIDEEAAARGETASSLTFYPSAGLSYADLYIPISQFTRVGTDQTKTLLNVNALQILVNNGAGAFTGEYFFSSLDICGGFSPDTLESGAEYKYVFRPRSSITGARGNPCPVARYGIRPRREAVQVVLPTTYPDSQVDYLDIFRVGGTLNAYTLVGTVSLGTANFLDNYADSDIVSSEQLDYEDFQPWPTVDIPFNVTATQVNGTTAVVSIPDAGLQANVKRYLPGNIVQVGQQAYTLWTRPTQITGENFLFQFVEDAGVLTNMPFTIYEPAMANQVLPYLWGPTENGGNIFGCGDSLRPGFVYFSKNFNPDSAPDRYNLELCPPSEPLLGGEVLDGNSYVASTQRWWQLRPTFGQENQYTPIEAPVGRGLAAPYGICTDGSRIYFVAKDGIYATSGGAGESLTNIDLYNLFPHEGISGANFTYNGVTVFAPDYGRAETFRLAYCNSYLYFDYQDSTGTQRTLVFDVRHAGWIVDSYLGGTGVSIHYGIEQQEGSLNTSDLDYGLLVFGGSNGKLYKESDDAIDGTNLIQCFLATREFTAGDERAQKLFGDLFLDFTNPTTSSGTTALTVSIMSLGVPYSQTNFTQSNTRQQLPVSLGAGIYSFAAGMFFSWVVPVAMPFPLTLYTWQPSYINKPESTTTRAEDWDDAGYPGNKWVQGFLVESITPNTKQIGVRNADTDALQQTFALTCPIQDWQAFSFTQPFYSHSMRLEPADSVDWQFFKVKWVWQPAPETVTEWWTQPSGMNFHSFGHCYTCEFSYSSQAPVNFTMFFDANSQNYQLPSTGGIVKKIFLNLQANKGKLYSFRAQSTAGFRDLAIWEESFVLLCGEWGRTGRYVHHPSVGGKVGTLAEI